MSARRYDVVVVGSGPNGLAAAITMAQSGRSVLVLETSDRPGGGARSEQLTLPGFIHDTCSAVHPLAVTSPFFTSLPLENFGLEWIHSPASFGHLLGDQIILQEKSIEATAAALGADERRYRSVFEPLVEHWDKLFEDTLRPVLQVPRHPILLARFGAKGVLPAETLARGFFRSPKTRALIAGVAAHANSPLDRAGTAGIALMLMIAGHAKGWPIPKGGAGSITRSLVDYFSSLGGEIELGRELTSLRDLPKSRWVFFDLPPSRLRTLFEAAGLSDIAARFAPFKHGPGVFKMDWALKAPVPWLAAEASRTATLHIGGSLEHVARAEGKPARGEHPKKPFLIFSQPTLFDSTRAPAGQHIAWAYCHVPNGSTVDMTEAIEDEIERHAPGFRARILARSTTNTRGMETRNSNLVGGDIGGGEFRIWRMIAPQKWGASPYEISKSRGYYICSSSAPPGPGVHGMCGLNAAHAALSERAFTRVELEPPTP